MRFKLYTGRTHQIRVHMAHVGHPLLDDFLYDPNASNDIFFDLHCTEIEFVHPYSNKKILVKSEVPSYFNEK